jgi:hypothetical protein
MSIIIQREHDGDFDLRIPEWIGAKLGDLLLMQFDGDRLTVSSATNFL